MRQTLFGFIFCALTLILVPACMFYPGNGEYISDPFGPIKFYGYVGAPNQKVYVYVKNTQTNQYVGILEGTS